jgi:deazaflavin-dependent oxidoreductase (nitroreductase family)
MSTPSAHNQQVIDAFRANGGKVEGRPLLVLLTTTGAKSGESHLTPVACLAHEDRYFIFASKKGSPNNPDWYTNLVANPDVNVEIGAESYAAVATSLAEPERTRIFDTMSAENPNFIEYQAATTRVIPVVELIRK